METTFTQATSVAKKLITTQNKFVLRSLILTMAVILGIGSAWASDSYYTGFKATGGATGNGYVYASTSNTATPAYETEVTAESQSSDLKSSSATKQYYAWAKAVRGSKFNGWSISGDNGNVTPQSGTDSPITVTVTSAKNKTNTGTATATWAPYTKVNVTYNASDDGEYTVAYSYNTYDATNKTITAGDAEGLGCTINSDNGSKTIGSYYNDVITLTSTKGDFQGWYKASDTNNSSNLLSTDNPYTYVAPQSGTGAIYPKYAHTDKYYGRLTASIAAVPYSMPGGGTIFVSKEEAGTGTYSADAQTVDNIGMGTTGLKYYLHAQPTDKRYVFRGWYSNPECTGTALSTNADYAYTFTSSSINSASPTLGNVYAAFDFNLYYMQVEAEPAVPGLGMVLVKDNNTGTPEYTNYATHSEQFLYAYRLAPTANAYLYAKPKYGYKFSGWYDNLDCTGTAKSTANPYTYAATGSSTDPMNPTIAKLYAKFVEDASTVNITYNRPDQTKGEYTASVLDIAEVDDDFIWTFTQVFTSEGKTGNTTQAQHKTDVLRLEAQSKAGYGVTSWTIAGAAKTTPSQLYETTGTAAATYGVTFGDAKPFLVCATTSATTGTAYASLAEALANLGTNKKIVVVQNAYVPAGNYTIPNGVTLLVPFDEAQTLYTTKPGITIAAPSGQSAYCTLTLGNGANVKVNGAISVSAHQNKGQPYGGAVTGKYGKIELKEGANITLNSGSYLYCWGYITGAGSVDALSGSTVYEDFQITCWRGGNCAKDMVGNDQKVFPLAQYAIQNVEARINFHYGSSETVYTGVTVKYFDPETSAKIIGTTDGLFQLSSGAVLSRWYNASVDRQMYELNGNASIGYVLINMYANIDSRKYVLPITNNMDITVKTGTLSCDNDFALLPGASITIDEGAKASLGSNSRLYVYDKAEWPEKTTGYNYPSNVAFCKVAYTDTKITTARTYANMADAKLDVNGTLEISKAIYTTAGGANICSSEGTGLIVLKAAAGTENITYQAIQESNYVKEYVAIPITAAQLHNGDDSYTLTAGAVANDQFIYSKSQEKWLKNPKVVSWNANGGTTEASTLAYSEGAFVGELPAAYKDGYTLEGWYTTADGGIKIDATTKVTANATYYAHWTPKTYTISYRDQGGAAFTGTHIDTPTPHPTTHTFGTATMLNSVNNKTDYTFGGWYRTPSCSGTQVSSLGETEVTKDITLYAKWTEIPSAHTLTWNFNGGTPSGSYTAAGSVATGATITYPTLSKTGYTLTWSTNVNTMPDEDLTITANWSPVNYTIGYTLNGGSATNPANYNIETATFTLNNPTKDGYEFAGWTGTGLESATTTVSIAVGSKGNRSYTATWTPTNYTITYNLDGGSATNPANYNIETATFTLNNPTKDGYEFAGWTGTGLESATTTVSIAVGSKGNRSYTATWTKVYTVNWYHEAGVLLRTDKVAVGETPYYGPEDPTKSSTDQEEFTFEGWSPEVGPITDHDVDYIAQFQNHVRYYTITWKNWDGKVLETYGKEHDMQYGAQIHYDVTPERPSEEGGKRVYAFTGWSPEYIPGVTTVSRDQEYIAQYELALNVPDGQTYNVTGTETPVATVVSGRLNVPDGTSLNTGELILEANASTNHSGDIVGAERVTATKARFDLYGSFKARTWYAVAVPWEVAVPAYQKDNNGVLIKKGDGAFVRQELGSTFDIIYYDGELRAKNGHTNDCWKYIEYEITDPSKQIMKPGIAYMIYMTSDADVIRFERKADAALLTKTLSVEAYDDWNGNSKDANWNGIANPATYQAYINANADKYEYTENAGQIYDGDSKSYSVVDLSDYKLVVGKPVFIQATVDKPTVEAFAEKNEAFHAPRRAMAHNDVLRFEVTLSAEDEAADRIIIRTNELKEKDEYVLGQDLVKMGVSSVVPQMWVDRYDSRLCINTIAQVNESAAYPLSLYAPQAGEYTISSDATTEDNVVLYLTFDGRPLWNLTYAPYVANLEKGTTQHYGLLLVRRNVPTDIDAIQADEQQPVAQKILLNGQVYILRGNELYSISGQIVK